MKFGISTLLAFFLSLPLSFAGEIISGKIVKLSDGDTLQFLPDGVPASKKLKVRLMAIDTAELHLPIPGGNASQGYWGEKGEEELAKYVSVGDRAQLEKYGEDDHGRVLGKIIKNGEDVNLKMVRSGWAALYLICEKRAECTTGNLSADDYDLYAEASHEAVKKHRGLFDLRKPVPELPFVFRANQQHRRLSRFVADVARGIYVDPVDYADIDVSDRLFYSDEKDAIDNGFKSVE